MLEAFRWIKCKFLHKRKIEQASFVPTEYKNEKAIAGFNEKYTLIIQSHLE